MGDRLEIGKVSAKGGLHSATQEITILIKPQSETICSKLGLELQLVPINQHPKGRPKSFFINIAELSVWDQLIEELVRARWKFAKQEKLLNDTIAIPIEQQVTHKVGKIKEAAFDGLKNKKIEV